MASVNATGRVVKKSNINFVPARDCQTSRQLKRNKKNQNLVEYREGAGTKFWVRK